MVAASVIDENRFRYSLDSLSKDFLKERKGGYDLQEKTLAWSKGTIKDPMSNMHKLPASIVKDYAKQDVDLTLKLWELFNEKFDEVLYTKYKEDEEGKILKVQARRGVIVASGGFGQNQEMREKYLPKPTNSDWGCEPKTNTGDPIKAAEAIGAQLKFMDKAWWVTTVKAPNEEFPRLSEIEKSLPGNYTVNTSGKRFANESQNYLTFMLEVLEKEKLGESCAPMYMIFDANHRKNYPVGPLMPGKFFPDSLVKIVHRDWFGSDFLTSASTVEELALQIGIDADALKATVNRVNDFSATGKDLDFKRGDNERDRFSGDPTLLNPCLGPVDKAPFYAMRIDPGEFATCGGMAINEPGQVLNNDNQPITGLYATGNCTPALLTTYPGPGATIGPAMTFGFIAAKHLSGSNTL
jgi:3-oxosteroid 1-dehydrogenase